MADKSLAGFIYFIEADGLGQIKIGFSEGHPVLNRLPGLQCGCPVPLLMRGYMLGTRKHERLLHRRFKHLRRLGEWFDGTAEIREFIAARSGRRVEAKDVLVPVSSCIRKDAISADRDAVIRLLRKAGWSNRRIAKAMNVSHVAVSRRIHKMEI